MSSSNTSTSRLGTCGSCQECPCHHQESDNPHYTPQRTQVPSYLIRNQRARRHPSRHHFNDRYQPAEDSYPRAEYRTGFRAGSSGSSRGLGENHSLEASNIYAESNSPSDVGYTFYSEDSNPEESLDYPEPSTISTNTTSPSTLSTDTTSPSILTPDYFSGILDLEDLPLDLLADLPQESTKSPGCLGKNYNAEEVDLHETFDLVKPKFPALFAAFPNPHTEGYLDQLMYLRANCDTLDPDPPTLRSTSPGPSFRTPSPASEDDPFYFLSAPSRRPSPATEDDPFCFLSARSRRQHDQDNHESGPDNEAGYQSLARRARVRSSYRGVTPLDMHSLYTRPGCEDEEISRDRTGEGLYGRYRDAHGDGDIGGMFTMRDSPDSYGQGLYGRYRAAYRYESMGEPFTMRDFCCGDWLGRPDEDKRQQGGESSNANEPPAYEYPSSGSRGDPLGYYPPSGHVPRCY
jgi:hypothetical protein